MLSLLFLIYLFNIEAPTTRSCGSSVGECRTGTQTCTNGVWSVCGGTYVGSRQEICNNNLDEDCDSSADNGCSCSPNGATQPCGTSNVGECRMGTRTCNNNVLGTCTGSVNPATEVCNDGRDNNCNNQVDENCPCSPNGITAPCGSDVGICRRGTQTCTNNVLGTCTGSVNPATEVCNDNLDNDCDGQADCADSNCASQASCSCSPNGATQPCGSDVGICRRGTQTCTNNVLGTCTGGVSAISEVCGDNLDNNCNGQVDENCGVCLPGAMESCGNNIGTCHNGTRTCQSNRQWGECTGGVSAISEVCGDNLDNDCNGAINNGCSCSPNNSNRSCGTNFGNCRMGLQTCTSNAWSNCNNVTSASLEICDGQDNNCDGTVDEGCSCTSGSSRACGSDTGTCRRGTQNCVNGQWSVCIGGIQPSTTETCGDNLDNNCDGTVDEGCSCTSGSSRACSLRLGVCSGLNQTCTNGNWSNCNYNLYNANYQSQETSCNDNKDNDCDGQADNQDPDCISLIQTCTGGISYSSCDQNNKPKYCTYGRLEDRCSICGCPNGMQCRNSDGACITPQVTSGNLRGTSCGNGRCEPGEVTGCPEDCKSVSETGMQQETTVSETGIEEQPSALYSWLWIGFIILTLIGVIGYYYYQKKVKSGKGSGQQLKKESFFEKIKNIFKKPPKQTQQPQYISPYEKYTRYWRPPQR